MLLLVVLLVATAPHKVGAVPSAVNRSFYLASPSSGAPVTPSTPGTLSSTPPSGLCNECRANVTTNAISFAMPAPLAIGVTIQGPLRMSLWIDYKFNQTAVAPVQAAFSYRFPGVNSWTNSNSTQQISSGLNNVTFNLPVQTTQLVEQSSVAIEVSVSSLPKNATIALDWGSSTLRSFIVIPMSGYATLFPSPSGTLVTIQDSNGNFGPLFYLNSPNNFLVVKVSVQSALGLADIQRVNVTIIDPGAQLVKRATNETMQGPLTGSCPCGFVGVWTYQSNSTQGTYQVLVNIIDVQHNLSSASSPYTSP